MANNDRYGGENGRNDVQKVEVRRVGEETRADSTARVQVGDVYGSVMPGGFAVFSYSPVQEASSVQGHMTPEIARAVLQRLSTQGMLGADPALISEAVRVLEERV